MLYRPMGSESRHRNVAPSREELAEALARAHRVELEKSRELLRRAEHASAEDPQARSVGQWFKLLVDELQPDSRGKQTSLEDRAAERDPDRPALGRQTLVIR